MEKLLYSLQSSKSSGFLCISRIWWTRRGNSTGISPSFRNSTIFLYASLEFVPKFPPNSKSHRKHRYKIVKIPFIFSHFPHLHVLFSIFPNFFKYLKVISTHLTPSFVSQSFPTSKLRSNFPSNRSIWRKNLVKNIRSINNGNLSLPSDGKYNPITRSSSRFSRFLFVPLFSLLAKTWR